jgi:membrane protein
MYGAFGVPVALLLWINFTSKLVLFCASWTATQSKADELPDVPEVPDVRGGSGGAPDPAAANGG